MVSPAWKHLWDKYGGFSGNYDCEEFGKVISGQDAAAFADALEKAAMEPLPTYNKGPVLIREGMTAVEYRQANAELGTAFLAEFIPFLRGGDFSFFWDD